MVPDHDHEERTLRELEEQLRREDPGLDLLAARLATLPPPPGRPGSGRPALHPPGPDPVAPGPGGTTPSPPDPTAEAGATVLLAAVLAAGWVLWLLLVISAA